MTAQCGEGTVVAVSIFQVKAATRMPTGHECQFVV